MTSLYIKKRKRDRLSSCIVSIKRFWSLFSDFSKFIYQFPNLKRRAHSVVPFCIALNGLLHFGIPAKNSVSMSPKLLQRFLVIHCPRTTISCKTCFQNFKSHFLKITIFDISTLNCSQMVIFAPRNFVLVSFERLSYLL